MYKCIIFDLDDTLCDYSSAKRKALDKALSSFIELGIDQNCLRDLYLELEPKLFKLFTSKKIDREKYRVNRFFFPVLSLCPQGLSCDKVLKYAETANINYQDYANTKVEMFEDAVIYLAYLQKRSIDYVILTNGPSDGQKRKVKHLKVIPEKKVFVSEDIVYAKPDAKAFEYVLQKLPFCKKECLFVGNSIEEDIKGANKTGIDCVLIDREGKQSFQGKTIRLLTELIK
ncbi:HAD family hydrolase [Candidatus Uabimicrobium amorphum]|uniref:Noncanonical pyrimidine nucleotidase, YjjGfamily protein n=1 Tax=Uabimicrobium amorphum TaxID=2596890 RepID=A0A5S9F1P0_UABAM|nr:HAD family hydrolase [Candidatus Uabimicrobium amorphum]BBM82776.1 noncanonical pyrimidine nucleotidase, YjjGfamily protein [Candidatus Uabimicrobium amorphum]